MLQFPELDGATERCLIAAAPADRFFAFGGCVKERTHGGALARVVVDCWPEGRSNRNFADPKAIRMAQVVADALNTADLS